MNDLTEMLRERARAALPPVEGELRLKRLKAPVQVLRDRWGVPHIYAENLHDLCFAQGFVQASERLFQIDLMSRTATGRLSELFGEMLLPLDRFIRTLGWNRIARHAVRSWDDRSYDIADAALEGMRAWLEAMPARPIEYDLLQIDPFVPEGQEGLEVAAAGAVFMAWSLSTNWDCELLRAQVADAIGWEGMAELFPDIPPEPITVRPGKLAGSNGRRAAFELLKQAPRFPNGQGSNNWVVSGARSTSGKPLLANDPHIFAQVPSIWFETHLVAPGVDVTGVAFPFASGVVIGHNDRIAWGMTNVGGDTQDLYVERLNEDRTAALYEGRWDSLTIHREEIAVRDRPEPDVLEVRETRHGPILDSYLVGLSDFTVVEGLAETYALRWVGAEHLISPSTILGLDQARDFDGFREVLRTWACPGQNFVYADVDGNIGYQCTGWHPIRPSSDGTIPVPGWLAECEWDGFVPFEELPWAYNPESGFLATANAKPHDETYRYDLGHDFISPFRNRRIAELLTATERHDRESFARIQMDFVSIPAREIAATLTEVEAADDRQKQALALLDGWDGDLAPDSAAAALYQVWSVRLAEAILLPRLGQELYEHFYSRRQWTNEFQVQVLPRLLRFPTARWFGRDGREARDDVLRRTLDEALDLLAAKLGEDPAGWSWGALHPVRFVHQIGARVPDLAPLFTGGEAPHGGDEQTVNQGTFEPAAGTWETVVVASWRQILDLSDLDASVGTHTVGQSGNPASPHWNDLFPLWSTGRHHPMPFTRPAVESACEHRLSLLPPS